MKILFAGDIENPVMSGSQRCNAFGRLGNTVIPFDTTRFGKPIPYWTGLTRRVLPPSLYERTLRAKARDCGTRLLRAAIAHRPDIVWLEWPRLINAEIVCALKAKLPGAHIVSFQNDNPFGARKRATHGWNRFLDAIPYYDLHFVKRKADLAEYYRRGARKVAICMEGYSEDIFFPRASQCGSCKYPVVFAGTPLDHRVTTLNELTGKFGLRVDIFGRRWKRTPLFPGRRRLLHSPLSMEEYRELLWQASIALGFVSWSNHDEFTMRSFEIPAAGTFLLAERTMTHQSLYVEGREAEFFDNSEECRDKLLYYLDHSPQRRQIAAAGHERCVKSGYGITDRLRLALQTVAEL